MRCLLVWLFLSFISESVFSLFDMPDVDLEIYVSNIKTDATSSTAPCGANVNPGQDDCLTKETAGNSINYCFCRLNYLMESKKFAE